MPKDSTIVEGEIRLFKPDKYPSIVRQEDNGRLIDNHTWKPNSRELTTAGEIYWKIKGWQFGKYKSEIRNFITDFYNKRGVYENVIKHDGCNEFLSVIVADLGNLKLEAMTDFCEIKRSNSIDNYNKAFVQLVCLYVLSAYYNLLREAKVSNNVSNFVKQSKDTVRASVSNILREIHIEPFDNLSQIVDEEFTNIFNKYYGQELDANREEAENKIKEINDEKEVLDEEIEETSEKINENKEKIDEVKIKINEEKEQLYHELETLINQYREIKFKIKKATDPEKIELRKNQKIIRHKLKELYKKINSGIDPVLISKDWLRQALEGKINRKEDIKLDLNKEQNVLETRKEDLTKINDPIYPASDSTIPVRRSNKIILNPKIMQEKVGKLEETPVSIPGVLPINSFVNTKVTGGLKKVSEGNYEIIKKLSNEELKQVVKNKKKHVVEVEERIKTSKAIKKYRKWKKAGKTGGEASYLSDSIKKAYKADKAKSEKLIKKYKTKHGKEASKLLKKYRKIFGKGSKSIKKLKQKWKKFRNNNPNSNITFPDFIKSKFNKQIHPREAAPTVTGVGTNTFRKLKV